MKLGDKIPVPELDELRLARMERAILAATAGQQRTQSSRWVTPMRVAVGLMAVAGVLAIALSWPSAQLSTSESVASLSAPTSLVTGEGQSSTLRLGDAVVEVGENTELSVQRMTDGSTLISLSNGTVHCEVVPRPNRPTFRVVSDDVEVTVIGTLFSVTRSNTVEVVVERGIVGVATSSQTVRLRAGENWQGSPYAHITLATLLAQAQEAAKEEAVAEELAAATAAKNSAKPSKPGKPGKPGKGRTAKQPKKPVSTERAPEEPVLMSDILKGAKPIPLVFKNSHGPELTRLRGLIDRDPEEAVAKLGVLVSTSTGSDASFALYSRAYVLFFSLGNNAAAVKAAKQYAKRFPKGAEAEDMLWLRVRASCDTDDLAACRAAAHTYLRRYPKGIFHKLAARLTLAH